MPRWSRSCCTVASLPVTLASVALATTLVAAACGGYSGPPDIDVARQGISPEYRIVYAGEDGKTALALLREQAESVVAEGSGDELLVTAINGIEGGMEGGMSSDRLLLGSSHQELADEVLKLAVPGDFVLVKGSRGAAMERLIGPIRAAFEGGAEAQAGRPAEGRKR